MLTASFTIPSLHPCLADHFPGHPIAPGVLTLDLVSRGLLDLLPGYSVTGFPQVKFLQPVLPEQAIEVSYTRKKDVLFQFTCVCDARTLVTGQISVEQKDASLG